MAKPIFIIGFPIKADLQQVETAIEGLEKKFGEDYHVLPYRTSNIEDVTFQVLNAVNSSDVEIAELIKKAQAEIDELRKENLVLKLETAGTKLIKNNQ